MTASKRGKIGREEQLLSRPNSDMLNHDLSLLKEYGFKKRTISSTKLNLNKIDGFGMRQLDRLKMLLLRNEFLVGRYPDNVRIGIVQNEAEAFALAIVILSPKLREMM